MVGQGEWDDWSSWGAAQHQIEHAAAFQGRLPNCVLLSQQDCGNCPLADMPNCPVRADSDYGSYLLHLRDSYVAYETKRRKRIEILKAILKRHKLSLHWENLAILVLKEAPTLFDSAHSVKAIVFFNPNIFHLVGDGVFELV